MADGFMNDSDVVEVNDTKASASIYYTLAMEKIRDVSANSAFTSSSYYYSFLTFIF